MTCRCSATARLAAFALISVAATKYSKPTQAHHITNSHMHCTEYTDVVPELLLTQHLSGHCNCSSESAFDPIRAHNCGRPGASITESDEAVADLKAVIQLLGRRVDGLPVKGAVCKVDVLAAVAQAVSLRHPLNDASLLCQWYHCKPEACGQICYSKGGGGGRVG